MIIRYRVTVPRWMDNKGVIEILENLRYSGDYVEQIENKEPLTLIITHQVIHRDFFYSHIKPRWESFGFKVEVLKEEEGFQKRGRFL